MEEYGKCDQKYYDKWKVDSRRFLDPSFLDYVTFPLLNDGRQELYEWLEGIYITDVFYDIWDDMNRFCAMKFVKSMRTEFYKRMNTNDYKTQICISKCCLILSSKIVDLEKEFEEESFKSS